MEYNVIQSEREYLINLENEEFLEWCNRQRIIIQNMLAELIEIGEKYWQLITIENFEIKRNEEIKKYKNKAEYIVELQQKAYIANDLCGKFCKKLISNNKPLYEEYLEFSNVIIDTKENCKWYK